MPAPSSSTTTTDSDADLLNAGFRYALALLHHREDAEDVAQEAWLNLHRRYGRVPSRATLFTAVKHIVIDRYRRAKVVSFETGEELDEPDPAASDAPGAEADVETLLGHLRQNEREALFLHYIEGRTAEEIGRMTEQPRNTVLSLMRRGLQKLRCIVSPDASGPSLSEQATP
ncbi:RNA polymerase sigma factor [Actomonas aquatica]|uniref:RNA polymerase sigma factor n=1 Tax=Actomonas aquatica TaxID=2866162 RepID=A0ABZ1C7M3_9BACT|nr:RNA polymerase sigma factor [Opitutus sp. WL0086]WRQ86310.1 RNA polymerase sigma factor [Opitutus sp. WL0086]